MNFLLINMISNKANNTDDKGVVGPVEDDINVNA